MLFPVYVDMRIIQLYLNISTTTGVILQLVYSTTIKRQIGPQFTKVSLFSMFPLFSCFFRGIPTVNALKHPHPELGKLLGCEET
jgi:hypothetical protein